MEETAPAATVRGCTSFDQCRNPPPGVTLPWIEHQIPEGGVHSCDSHRDLLSNLRLRGSGEHETSDDSPIATHPVSICRVQNRQIGAPLDDLVAAIPGSLRVTSKTDVVEQSIRHQRC